MDTNKFEKWIKLMVSPSSKSYSEIKEFKDNGINAKYDFDRDVLIIDGQIKREFSREYLEDINSPVEFQDFFKKALTHL